MTQTFTGFPPETVSFLTNLKANNTREWFATFQEMKPVYDWLLKV